MNEDQIPAEFSNAGCKLLIEHTGENLIANLEGPEEVLILLLAYAMEKNPAIAIVVTGGLNLLCEKKGTTIQEFLSEIDEDSH